MITLLIISSLINLWLLGKIAYAKFDDNHSPVMKQLIDSLSKDDGWKYLSADSETADAFTNKKIGITFSLARNLRGGPRIYEPFEYLFSEKELKTLSKIVDEWAARLLMSKRIDALNSDFDKMLTDGNKDDIVPASKENTAVKTSRRKK